MVQQFMQKKCIFTVANKTFCLSLHYNSDNSYLFVNGNGEGVPKTCTKAYRGRGWLTGVRSQSSKYKIFLLSLTLSFPLNF